MEEVTREVDTYEVRVPAKYEFGSDRVIERHRIFWVWLFVLGVLAATLLVAAALPAMPDASFDGLEAFAVVTALASTLVASASVIVSVVRSWREPRKPGRHGRRGG